MSAPHPDWRLDGRVVVITGAASGIGEATAETLAGAGATVVLGDLDELGARAVADRISAAGGEASAHRVDVSARGSVDALVAAAVEGHGRLDVMANVAGIGSYGLLEDVTEEEIDRVVGINLKGTLFGCQAALAAMKPRGSGSIINVSATAINTPVPIVGLYSATKAAVAMLTQTLAVEAGPHGIRVNTIAPGFTVTNFVGGHLRDATGKRDADAFAAYLDTMRASSPLGILGEASDQALAILYLASDAARFTTGAILRINGGQAMPW